MPCIARFSFSISLFELLATLISGGTAMLFPRERILELDRFVKDLERVTNLHTVPGLMWQIVDSIEAKRLDNNKYSKLARIFIGGDIVPPDLLERIQKIFPAAQIYVLYGCSEATTLLRFIPAKLLSFWLKMSRKVLVGTTTLRWDGGILLVEV
jgi:non-ribosomal peptide synthetase component F